MKTKTDASLGLSVAKLIYGLPHLFSLVFYLIKQTKITKISFCT